jgi:pimeloyl-ACP methyl ester carboxylesterase
MHDDDLSRFEAEGAAPLPVTDDQGYVENEGAQIWYASYGSGAPVILLHGGLGNGGNWGYQVPALVRAGYRVVLIDSRGHGRSTRDARPYSYELMASDVSAVMNGLHLAKAVLVGWSDGACTALVLASKAPAQVAGVFFFGCNMDPSGTKKSVLRPIIGRCLNRHKQDFARLSATPDQFDSFLEAVGLMQGTQPDYSVQDLAEISVPVAMVHSYVRRHCPMLGSLLAGREPSGLKVTSWTRWLCPSWVPSIWPVRTSQRSTPRAPPKAATLAILPAARSRSAWTVRSWMAIYSTCPGP